MSASGSSSPPDRLPSGRHRLSRAAVYESQHARLLFAVGQVVADKGYRTATVSDIVERAGVSRTTFYEHFEDKEACFLAAFDFAVDLVLGRMRAAWEEHADHRNWRAHVRSDLETFLQTLSDEPSFAFALHIEALAAGPAALARRAKILALFSERTRRIHALARSQEPQLPALPEETFKLHTGGMDELIREQLRARGPGALLGLLEALVNATLALLGDKR